MNELILTTIQVSGTEDTCFSIRNSKKSLVKVKDPRQETITTTMTLCDNEKMIQDEEGNSDN